MEGPELAMERMPRVLCLRVSLISSGKRPLPFLYIVPLATPPSPPSPAIPIYPGISPVFSQIDSPPVPVPVGSPPWIMNLGMFRWKMTSL